MELETVISNQGTLTASLPKSLWGKKVLISIQPIPEQETLFDIFTEADKLNIPRYSHEEILQRLYTIRS